MPIGEVIHRWYGELVAPGDTRVRGWCGRNGWTAVDDNDVDCPECIALATPVTFAEKPLSDEED